MPTHSRYTDAAPYLTKDGSEIRELMHPALHGNSTQSLAEATLPPGGHTRLHRHHLSEELYHVTAGHGRMRLGTALLEVGVGDTICIPPGTPHALYNGGDEPLRVLCCCAPAYRHEDTVLLPEAHPPSPDAGD